MHERASKKRQREREREGTSLHNPPSLKMDSYCTDVGASVFYFSNERLKSLFKRLKT